MEEKSGVRFHQAQVALARQWIGENIEGTDEQPTEVEIRIPTETTEGLVVGDKTEIKTEKLPIPPSEQEAREIIERFEAAARDPELQHASAVSDNVVQHMLADRTALQQERWDGTDEEELQSYVSAFNYCISHSLADRLPDMCPSFFIFTPNS
jgi:phospholipase D1/2